MYILLYSTSVKSLYNLFIIQISLYRIIYIRIFLPYDPSFSYINPFIQLFIYPWSMLFDIQSYTSLFFHHPQFVIRGGGSESRLILLFGGTLYVGPYIWCGTSIEFISSKINGILLLTNRWSLVLEATMEIKCRWNVQISWKPKVWVTYVAS